MDSIYYDELFDGKTVVSSLVPSGLPSKMPSKEYIGGIRSSYFNNNSMECSYPIADRVKMLGDQTSTSIVFDDSTEGSSLMMAVFLDDEGVCYYAFFTGDNGTNLPISQTSSIFTVSAGDVVKHTGKTIDEVVNEKSSTGTYGLYRLGVNGNNNNPFAFTGAVSRSYASAPFNQQFTYRFALVSSKWQLDISYHPGTSTTPTNGVYAYSSYILGALDLSSIVEEVTELSDRVDDIEDVIEEADLPDSIQDLTETVENAVQTVESVVGNLTNIYVGR